MANYKTHSSFNIFIALPVILFLLHHFIKPSFNLLITFSICFIYSTLFMNPDLDIANQIKLFSLRGFLTLPFRSYSHFFRHRGISHMFLIGSLTRVLWLGVIAFIIFYIFDISFFNAKKLTTVLHNKHFLYCLFALSLADLCHLMLDIKIN